MKFTLPITTLTVLVATGCLGDDTGSDARASREQALQVAPSALSTDEFCRSFVERQHACTAAFIPALVDARVAGDNPPGIRARAEAMGRDALVEEALAEWSNDSTPGTRDAMCNDIAQSISPEKDRELRTALSECLAQNGCDGFTRCAVPLSLMRWKG